MYPDEESAARERRRLSRREWADALNGDDDRRAWSAFRRRSWERHPVLYGLRIACVVAAGFVMLIRLNWPRDERPSWTVLLPVVLIAAAGILWVMLVRRDESPEA